METVIKKAIEGGWECSYDSHVIEMNARKFGKSTAWKMRVAYFTQDPLFWQALGQAMKWEKSNHCESFSTGNLIPQWHAEWLRFTDHLAEEKDPELFFKDLIK